MSYITLTTDFGASPGVMKGVIWRIAPSVQIADLSHTIRPQDVRQAALILARQVYYFPENTIHVAVVDPGVGTARRPIAAQIGPQRVVGPDNGIFTPSGVEIDGLVRTFGDRQPGTLIALFGSSGHLMIAVVNGRAADRLHPSIGDQVEVIRQK